MMLVSLEILGYDRAAYQDALAHTVHAPGPGGMNETTGGEETKSHGSLPLKMPLCLLLRFRWHVLRFRHPNNLHDFIMRPYDVPVHLSCHRVDWSAAFIILLRWFSRVCLTLSLNNIIIRRPSLYGCQRNGMRGSWTR